MSRKRLSSLQGRKVIGFDALKDSIITHPLTLVYDVCAKRLQIHKVPSEKAEMLSRCWASITLEPGQTAQWYASQKE